LRARKKKAQHFGSNCRVDDSIRKGPGFECEFSSRQ
jgi:hypothetical protein